MTFSPWEGHIMKSHKDLDVWKLSMDLAVEIYGITTTFPSEERFGMTAQLRGAASAIPSNIAEGAARKGKKEFIQFLYIALASASELDTQLELSGRVNLCSRKNLEGPIDRTARVNQMLRGLVRSLQARASS